MFTPQRSPFLLLAMLTLLACSSRVVPSAPLPPPPPVVPPPSEPLQLRLNERGELSLRADAVPLSRVLAELQKQHQIEVQVPDIPDVVVTTAFDDVPLLTAIERILPEGARSIVRVGERELALPARATGTKPGRVTQRKTDQPRKDTVAVIPLVRERPAKREADAEQAPRRPQGRALKPSPSDTIVRGGTGSKRPARVVQDTTRHIWLSLRVDTLRNLQVTGVRVLEGPRIISTVPQGTYFYLVVANGRPVAIESFYDPFEQHAYGPVPTDPHRTVRVATADLTATIPLGNRAELLDSDVVVRVYRLRPGSRLPRVDLESAAQLVRSAELVAASQSGALRGPIREALERPPGR